MLFAWLKRRRRRSILERTFPQEWITILDAIPHVAALAGHDRPRHQNLTQILLAEKTFEGCNGFEITDLVRVTIAGLAAMLVLGMDEYVFDNVYTVLVYPDAFSRTKKVPIAGDIALEDQDDLLGEAHYRGPVILTWAEIQEDVREPWMGRNLVFHEFAHQLDMLNGEADGVPNLPKDLREPWAMVMAKEYEMLRRRLRRHRRTSIDPYGASEPAEFFAVVTEAFFDSPVDLAAEHPELYGLLSRYFRQDPAKRELK